MVSNTVSIFTFSWQRIGHNKERTEKVLKAGAMLYFGTNRIDDIFTEGYLLLFKQKLSLYIFKIWIIYSFWLLGTDYFSI
jgi:hypothetical protein